jgi:nucleotide-binding universal stress UspA family protein
MTDATNISDPVAAWTLHKQRVLVPFDFSEASRKALQVARSFVPQLAGQHGGTVSVLHVITPPPLTAPGRLLRGPFDEERAIAHGFGALREALADASAPEFEPHVRVASNPAEEIVAFAEREQTELIIISSHARTGFDRWLIGSTAERVVRLAPCPVLVLRGPRPQ